MERCIVVDDECLDSMYIAEDDIPRDGGLWPEYAYTMIVCVDSFDEKLARGRLYTYYFEDALAFSSLDQLLLNLTAVMRKAGVPQPTHEYRSFMQEPNAKKDIQFEGLKSHSVTPQKPFYGFPDLHPKKGALASFYIRVFAQQHASMQGVLVWPKHKEKDQVSFRSAMELLILLEEALTFASEMKK